METKVLSVSLLNQYIKNLIEGDYHLNNIIVKGEICNLNKHYTGHYYFSIKDEESKISCMMFSYYVKNLKFDVKNGDEVLIFGYISCYEKNGSYQLYAKMIEPYGLGKELLKLEELKKKLKAEGIFDKEKKKLPLYPNKIGLVTSKTGAAVHDFIHTIQSRWNCEIDIYPCLVQGNDAPLSIINALTQADNDNLDVIILGRGGGANEDLSCFNDEALVRLVSSLKTPIITAVGHQIDTSLVDLVSDCSCITPTDAGQKATPNKEDIIYEINQKRAYLNTLMNEIIASNHQKLLTILSSKGLISPIDKYKLMIEQVDKIKVKNNHLINDKLNNYKYILESYNARLNSLCPSNLLIKGYTMTYHDGKIITSIDDVKKDDIIQIKLKDGILETKVIKKEREE